MTPTPAAAALQSVLAAIAPCPVIFADQNTTQPARPFVLLRTLSERGTENEEYRPVRSDGTAEVRSPATETIELQAYGNGANALLHDLRQRLRWETTTDRMEAAAISIGTRGAVQSISALLGTAAWEERALMEIGVMSMQSSLDPVGLIETVNTTGNFGGSSVNVVANVHVVRP